jgi:hypothetical protein
MDARMGYVHISLLPFPLGKHLFLLRTHPYADIKLESLWKSLKDLVG